ncbi:DNA polymerase I [Fusibacter sp. JL216-2]|uniref:DNA polymerase I n=1 Tax=Fusibacter sp. JL216-2 TaxID=3071453 RepID=UPI003D33F104
MKDRVVIIDGNSLINQAFYATRYTNMMNKDGVPTNAVYGFVNMMLKIRDDLDPIYMAVAFDMKGPTFRHKQFKEYKGTRKGMPDELAVQMPILKEMLDAMGIYRMELQGFEADDLIGTVAHTCSGQGVETFVVTGDQDALQLVSEKTTVLIKGRKKEIYYTPALVLEDYGVTPDRIIDLKGLQGDTSDNIPGLPGVGPKTAVKLLDQFGTVEELIQRSEEVTNKRIRGIVEDHQASAILSKKLATIEVHVPIDFSMEELKITPPDLEKLLEMIKEYGFNSLIKRIRELNVEGEMPEQKPFEYRLVTSEQEARDLAAIARHEGKFAFHSVYDKTNVRTNEIVGMGVYLKGKSYYIAIKGDESILGALKSVFEDPSIDKVTYEAKKDYLILQRYGIQMQGLKFDGFIAMYLLEPGRKSYDMTDVAMEKFSETMKTEKDLLGTGKKMITYAEIEEETIAEYTARYATYAGKLQERLETEMEKLELTKLYETVELPLIEVLANIEFEGFSVDTTELKALDEELTVKIEELTKDIYHMAEGEFNINSPKQLGVVLFETLGLPAVKKTKTGYSTSHDVLEKLMDKHPIIPAIIEYRTYTKLKSTYIDGIFAVINDSTGKIHTSLNQTVAVTGRLSSTEPNLQNIPVRLPLGRRLRKVFVPSEGQTLIDADYSQIELRVLAQMSEDDNLIKAFTENIDVHAMTASQVFDVPLDEVTSLERSRAKEVNFGIVYGMSDYGLSENLGITRKEAKTYIENYFAKYPKVKEYMDEMVDHCKENGYVTTILNRRRYVPEINHKNFNLRSFGERTAMNTPIQGSAADIIKIAMLKVYKALKEKDLKSKLILQVHDELIIDTHPDEVEQVKALLRENMETAADDILSDAFKIPLKVDMNEGESWYDTK